MHKKQTLFSTCLAFVIALVLGIGIGGTFLAKDSFTSASLPRIEQFAAAAPASVNTSVGTQQQVAPPAGTAMSTEQVVDQVGPSVVTVINRQKYSGRGRNIIGGVNPNTPNTPNTPGGSGSGTGTTNQPIDTGLGSGVIYDKQGYILTNNHVVEGATAIDVVLADGSRVDATLVGRDPSTDVAVVQIDSAKVPAVAKLGDSAAVKAGQRVVAIGSPETLENTVTEGIVSGTNRSIDTYVGLIQTDAAINHGNSGGPLINMQGEVIGLNTLGIRDNNAEGLNFAIAINKAKQVAQALVSKGNGAVVVTRAYLGVTSVALDSAKVQQYGTKVADGAYVDSVQSGAPADKAGLKKGDVITAVNGTNLNARTGLGEALSALSPGDKVTLTVDRNGSTQTLTATLVERPASTTP